MGHQVYAFIQKANTPVNIFLEGIPSVTQFIIPAGTYDLKGSNFVGFTFANAPFNVTLEDDVHIISVNRLICNAEISSYNNTGDAISCVSNDLCVFVAQEGCVIGNFGNSPIFTVRTGSFDVLALMGGRTAPGAGNAAILHIPSGQTGLVYATNGAYLSDNLISGPLGSIALLEHDGSINFPLVSQSLFMGSWINAPFGVAGGAGPTSFRPDSSGMVLPLSVGCMYFDTDLGYPIWWDGTAWVDSSGTPV